MRRRPTALLTLALGPALAVAVLAACRDRAERPAPGARPPAARSGRLRVAVTVDWEGVALGEEGLAALEHLRAALPGAPFTHFVCPAYLTKDAPIPDAGAILKSAVRAGDEVGVHVHGWRSLARAAGLTPKLAPSFLAADGKLVEFPDGDLGFEVDLEAYDVTELRALVATSRRLLRERAGLTVSAIFRAGGFLATPAVLEAIRAEGIAVDSSAIEARPLEDELPGAPLPGRLRALWPRIEATSQPYPIATEAGPVVELPIAGAADYLTASELFDLLARARAALDAQPERDVVLVLVVVQETADDFAPRLEEAFARARKEGALDARTEFVTVSQASASRGLAPAAASR